MNRFSAPSTNAISRLLLAAVVSVSILQTPLPMAHVHSGIESAGHLSEHLDRHHHGDAVQGDEIHWHLVLPGESTDDESGHSDQPTSLALVCIGSSSSTASIELSELQRLPQLSFYPVAIPIMGDLGEPRPTAAPCSLSASKRTCALLCVIRC